MLSQGRLPAGISNSHQPLLQLLRILPNLVVIRQGPTVVSEISCNLLSVVNPMTNLKPNTCLLSLPLSACPLLLSPLPLESTIFNIKQLESSPLLAPMNSTTLAFCKVLMLSPSWQIPCCFWRTRSLPSKPRLSKPRLLEILTFPLSRNHSQGLTMPRRRVVPVS